VLAVGQGLAGGEGPAAGAARFERQQAGQDGAGGVEAGRLDEEAGQRRRRLRRG
jgi:hypothetical protein